MSILSHEIYTGHCPKIKYQIVQKMKFRNGFEALKSYLFASRLSVSAETTQHWRSGWDASGGVEPSIALRIPLNPFLWGSPWTFVLWTLFWKVLSRSLTLVQLVSPQGFPGKGASTVPFWGDSAHRRRPAVPVQSPLSCSRTDWPAVSVGFIWPGLEYICCRQNTTRKQCKNPSQAVHWSPW